MVCAKIFLSAHGRLPPTISKYCKLCGTYNDICPDFEEQVCIVRLKPTYVCNACEERSRCTLLKTLYSAVKAQQAADRNISESRRGVLSTEQELSALNELIAPLILQGHSVHQIYTNNVVQSYVQ